MNRIEERFQNLKNDGRKGLIIYIGAGDPDLEATRRLAIEFDRIGVDVLELGVPFSDPLADGVVNQLAAQRGLQSGTTPPGVLRSVVEIRKSAQIPIVLYIYYNLVFRYGLERFIKDAAEAGVDGLLVLDLPPDEAGKYHDLMNGYGLCPIYLIAPTTPEERIKFIVNRARGFVYYVSREGVTGMQSGVPESLPAMVSVIKKHTSLPVAVGFGISNSEQAKIVAQHADAVVVGSAVVDRIGKMGKSSDMVTNVTRFVQELSKAVKLAEDYELHKGE
ncbi:MAG: tryptophan synthase subunit alpha [Verrucomicrobiae bacterium]|nr:tryptophan synthase subunit alpha [Verrucomicrobiae bacterium]